MVQELVILSFKRLRVGFSGPHDDVTFSRYSAYRSIVSLCTSIHTHTHPYKHMYIDTYIHK